MNDLSSASPLDRLARDLDWIEGANDAVVVHENSFPCRYRVPRHSHRRRQLLCAFSGVVLVETARGRFMVPPGHALQIPAQVPHEVEMLSDVVMKSVYVAPSGESGGQERPAVVEVSDLARSLLVEALRLRKEMSTSAKSELVLRLLVEEIAELPERPLGLPFPGDRRLAGLCRDFMHRPNPNARLDDWAARLAMSRRTFTRFFRQETGISFVAWRQQASVVGCLPRLSDGASVTEVALEAGYENAAAFTTMFRRVLGAAPRAYIASGRSFGTR